MSVETTPPTDTKPPVVPKVDGSGNENEQVSFSEFKAVKDDMHRFKEDARKNKEELDRLKTKEMSDKEQWKELAATRETEAKDWRTKYEAVTGSIQERAKISAVKESAIKLGLVESAYEDLELIELKDVIVETTSTGRVNVIGAKSAAERIKSLKPHWFANGKGPNLNPNVPSTVNGVHTSTSYDDLVKLEADAKKTGDYTEYKKKLMELKTKRSS